MSRSVALRDERGVWRRARRSTTSAFGLLAQGPLHPARLGMASLRTELAPPRRLIADMPSVRTTVPAALPKHQTEH